MTMKIHLKLTTLAILGLVTLGTQIAPAAETIGVTSLLKEMVDFENLAQRPEPPFKEATASSYDRESHKGGAAWFANSDVGQYVRTETNDGRREHVLADLKGPGTITRFWSANPTLPAMTRFYFDGEKQPRFAVPLADLFTGKTPPFGPVFSYISATGGNLYYPLPYTRSLKITVEQTGEPIGLYYEIGYRTYPPGTAVETLDPKRAGNWAGVQSQVAEALSEPMPLPTPPGPRFPTYLHRLTIQPGETKSVDEILGEQAVYEWSAGVDGKTADPVAAQKAYRDLLLDVRFDGQRSILTPLGDFFGSGPGVNPYENLFFTVRENGKMISRLLMPFKQSMQMSLTNLGTIPYTVRIRLRVGPYKFTDRTYHLRAQWGSLSRHTRPFFDVNYLKTSGEGKVIGTVYQIANPVLIWWGEGDQKVFIDGESFPSTFGTGTEDDYGYAYGNNQPFTRPYHAQTRVDGPASGGHISLNRWYVLDALPYRTGIRFDQEMWHWMPCKPTWAHVIYWYAKPGTPGPREIDRKMLAPPNLGIRADMLEPLEGESLQHEETGGKAEPQRLANCLGATHLFWHDAKPGDRLTMHFAVPKAGRYSVELNLCMAPDYGRQKLSINGKPVAQVIDGYWPELSWQQAKLGVFDLNEGDNTLVAEALDPNPKAKLRNLLGLDYIFLIRQPPETARDYWDILLLQGQRIGYCHTTVRRVVEAGRELVRTESVLSMSLRRGNDTSTQEIRSMNLETPDGKLLRLESQIGLGPTAVKTTGEVKGDHIEIETSGAASAAAKSSVPCPPDVMGSFAVDESLIRKPMQPGERRTFKSFLPELQQVTDIEMTARKFEPCKLPTGTHELLRIDAVTRFATGQKIEQTIWTDRTGETLKTFMPTLGAIETYRVSKAEALKKLDAAQLDLVANTMVKIDPPLSNPYQTKQVRYRVHVDKGDPAALFVSGPTQAIKSIDAHTAEITVYAIRPGQPGGNANAPPDPPTQDDLRPNVLVQSDDPLIVADAKKAAGDEKDPWRVAVALEGFVNRAITKKNFTQTFASAAEVAKSREGDCTEHGVFLMALCRARGIPARAAIGLVYVEPAQAFGYHLWTEVYIDKRWIPIDGTLALGGIDAAHLKVAQTNLKDASGYSAFLPVMQLLGGLSIKVIDAK
jgi:hypothetical protein